MVVSTDAEEKAWILQDLSCIGERSHGIVRCQVYDFSAAKSLGAALRRHVEIGTVGIDIGISETVDSGVFKQPWRIDDHRIPVQTDHVLSQFGHPGCPRIRLLSFRNTAAEIKVSASVFVHKHCRVKQPGNAVTCGCFPADQRLSDRIRKRPYRAVCRQHADSAARVGKIKEEFVLPVNRLPCRTGSP